MTPSYRVLPSADSDLDGQAGYLMQEAGLETALRFYDAAAATFENLARMPGMGERRESPIREAGPPKQVIPQGQSGSAPAGRCPKITRLAEIGRANARDRSAQWYAKKINNVATGNSASCSARMPPIRVNVFCESPHIIG